MIYYLKPGQLVRFEENVYASFRVGVTGTSIDSSISWDKIYHENLIDHTEDPIGNTDIETEPDAEGIIHVITHKVYLEDDTGKFYYLDPPVNME